MPILFRSLKYIVIVAALAGTVSACAGDQSRESKAVPQVANDDPVSRWIGRYDPLARACEKDILTINESEFTWGDCKSVATQLVSVSPSHLAFSVNSDANCGWAGWIVELTTPSQESRAVSVSAYRTLKDYESKERKAFCAYAKNR
jgi:hypothetical protein